MSSNKLYNFVHTVLFKNNRQKVDKATLFQHTHLNGTSYYLLQLPKKNNQFPEGLTLTEHHISIYEQPLNIIDKKSEYHYTALFTDQQRNTYRLHVYFNQFDEMIPPPHLALETGNQQYEPIAVNEFNVNWFDLSQKAINSVITQLRTKQNEQCTLFKNRIEPLDKRTVQLSANLAKNKKVYLNLLAEQIELSSQLNVINSEEDNQKQIELLRTIYHQVDSEIPSRRVRSKKTKKAASSAIESPKTDELEQEKAIVSLKKQPRSPKSNVKEEQFAPKINKLSDELLQVGAISNESEKATVIQVLFQQISELQLMVPSSQTNLIQMLKKMEQSIITIGRKHLHLLLAKNKFDAAAQLSPLFPVALDETVFNKALLDLNADLLDFLLKNGRDKLEQFEPKINKKSYGSIIEYLFQCDLSSSKVAQCFQILLSHKISLLKNDSAGLPFLLPLIEDENHPLTKIFIKNLKSSPENLRLLKLTINYFGSQKKLFLPDTIPYQRISNALIVMKKLDEELNKELPLKKTLPKNNFLSKLDSILEESQAAMHVFMGALTMNFLDICEESVKDTTQKPSKFQKSDIYGGLGLFTIPEEPSPREETPELMMKKTN